MANLFVALDFETANSNRASACQIGIAKFENGVLIDQFETLIRPHSTIGHFDFYNTAVHGLTERDVVDSPEFDKAWASILEFTRGATFVAHNAGFDMSVLRGLLNLYEIEYPEIEYFCTLMLARNLIKPAELNLKFVSKALNVELTRHHDALADAVAAGGIAAALIDRFEVNNLKELGGLARIKPGVFSAEGWTGTKTSSSGGGTKETLSAMQSRLSNEINHEGPLKGLQFVITGTLPGMTREQAREQIVLLGGTWSESVSRKTSYLVEAEADPSKFKTGETMSSKSRAVYDLHENGVAISILDAEGFFGLISG